MQGTAYVGRVIRLGRAMEPEDNPIADKLGEWQRRLALIKLMDLHARLRRAGRCSAAAAARALQLDMRRDMLIYLALVSASEPEERVNQIEAQCLELEAELRTFDSAS